MSRTDDTTRETRDATSSETRSIAGMLRHMSITLTSAPFWRTVGHLLLDNTTKETRDPSMFSGIGFYSRPAPGANAEAVVASVGGYSNPIIIAARDEDARKKHAELAQDETAMFNRLVIAVIKAIGTMEIRTANGTAVPLVTLPQFLNHTHATAGTGTPSPPVAISPSPPLTGTTVLKAQ